MKNILNLTFICLCVCLLLGGEVFGSTYNTDKPNSQEEEKIKEEEKKLKKTDKTIVQFSGVVIDANDLTPVPFVSIYIENSGRGTVADANGFFTFVAVSGENVKFTSIGFKSSFFHIPDTISHDYYSIIHSLNRDTIMLTETVIYPWPSKERFREAFLNLELPEQAIEILRKNFNLAKMRELARDGKMDANMNYNALSQYRTGQLYYKGQVAPNNLLNPFAWKQFVQKWKNQKDANASEGTKSSDSYSEDYKDLYEPEDTKQD